MISRIIGGNGYSKAMRLPILLPLLFLPSAALAQGSGSKASLSLLELDEPILGCLIPGAELALDPEVGADLTVEVEADTTIWAITFDQSLVEIEYEQEFYFARAEDVKVEPCATRADEY